MKKLTALLISALFVTGIFAGCNRGSDPLPQNPSETTPINSTANEALPSPEPSNEETEPLTEAEAPSESNPAVEATAPATPVSQASANNAAAPTEAAPTQAAVKIAKDEAKSIALKHAGVSESEISRYKSELDRERSIIVYEIEFDSGKYEYDYEIDANSGKVIKSEKEFRD